MKPYARAVLQRPGVVQQIERDIQAAGCFERLRFGQRVAARNVGDLDAAEVDGDAMSGRSRHFLPAVNLDAADFHRQPARQQEQFLILAHRSGNEGSGYDRAESLYREHAIDGQADRTGCGSPAYLPRGRFERYRAALRDARTPQERRRFQLALAAFRLPELIDRTLGLTLTDEVPTQDVALVLIRAFANPAARERTWRFITRRWTQLRRRLPPMMIARVIEATPALQTPAMMREVAAFFGAHPVPTATRALRQALERFDVV